MTLRAAGPFSGYIPQNELGQAIAFIRNPSQFAFNRYIQLMQSGKPSGLYTRISRDESVRVTDLEQTNWADGADIPNGNQNQSKFDTDGYVCQRHAHAWRLGKVAEETSTLWRPKLTQISESLSKCMTRRTWQVATTLLTASNWGTNNTADVNTINGGLGSWKNASDDPSSPKYNAICASLLKAMQRINKYTNSVVKVSDMRLVLGPDLASEMGRSPEIKNYVRETPMARQEQMNPGGNVNALWGLPSHYQGVEICVEDAVRVSEAPQAASTGTSEATANRDYIWSSDKAALVSRIGALDGGEIGMRNFSTVQWIWYQDQMRMKMEYDATNERYNGWVIDFGIPVLAAPVSGFLFTNCLA